MCNGSIERSNWEKLFECKNIHNHVCFFKKIIVNIFHKFIPNKIICNGKDQKWFNYEIRQMLNKKNKLNELQGGYD